MEEKVGASLALYPGQDRALSVDELDAAGFAKLLKQRQRAAFAALGMNDAVFAAIVGTRTAEERIAVAARMGRSLEYEAHLKRALERGSLEGEEPPELPWNEKLQLLPDGPLKTAIKEAILSWSLSGMELPVFMKTSATVQRFWRHPPGEPTTEE